MSPFLSATKVLTDMMQMVDDLGLCQMASVATLFSSLQIRLSELFL